MPRKPPQTELEAAIAELDAVRNEWLTRPGVTAVDVGFELKGGVLTEGLAIRVHVEPGFSPEAEARFPPQLGRFPVIFIRASYGPQAQATAGKSPSDGDG